VLLLNELAALTANFVESYVCVLKGVESLKDRTLSEKELLKKIQEYGKARLAVGEIHRPESLSSVNLANAIKAFKDEGILSIEEGVIEMKTTVWDQHKRDLKRILDVLNHA
jgi:glycerol-3-phosphate O-acyltransferase